MSSDEMTSTRPYLLRAMHEWIVDNGMTPHLLVDATVDGVAVPPQHVEDGSIVLNAGPTAVRDLELGNEWVSFSARFAGVAQEIFVPIAAVQAVYARENGQGMFFGEPQAGAAAPQASHQDEAPVDSPPRAPSSAASPTAAGDTNGGGDGDTDGRPPKPSGRSPHLKVVK